MLVSDKLALKCVVTVDAAFKVNVERDNVSITIEGHHPPQRLAHGAVARREQNENAQPS